VLMDHVLGSLQTDLKYTVLLVCEDVAEFRSTVHDKQQEGTEPAASDVALLEGLEGDYQFRSRLSEGDSIPRCDATLLKIPVSKRELEKEKHAAKKAIKKKIKKFKKSSGGA